MSEKCLVQITPTTTRVLDVHIRGAIEDFEDYDDLLKRLADVGADDVVNVHLNTPGGDCSIGFFLIDQFMALPCPVNMIVDYPTYSMGAIMALCGDSLVINPDSYIMFHDYSGGSRGKGGETHMYSTNYRTVFMSRFNRLCQPFLSKKECDNMFRGEDIYIHAEDETLPARLGRHFK